jgi:hypothetical protein
MLAADLLQNITTPTITGSGLVKRVPFAFTSTARLIRSGKLSSLGNSFAAATAKASRKNQLLVIEQETRPISTTYVAAKDLVQSIVPFKGVSAVISMAVNPHTVKWTQSKRYSKRDTMEGSVFFHFTNSADQNHDILTCTFTGRTGNINTKVNFTDALLTGSNMKLRIFHDLYNLSREGMLLNEHNMGSPVATGIRNEFFISYRTVLMQVPLTLVGFFNSVLEFTEDASDPFNRTYSFSFTVTDTSPSLDDLSSQLGSILVVTPYPR